MKTRFIEESQIIAAIDLCYQRSAAFYRMAEEWDKLADEYFKDNTRIIEARELRSEAKKKRTRAFNLINKKAKGLGEKLSEFRTAIIPCVTDDTSVSTKLK